MCVDSCGEAFSTRKGADSKSKNEVQEVLLLWASFCALPSGAAREGSQAQEVLGSWKDAGTVKAKGKTKLRTNS